MRIISLIASVLFLTARMDISAESGGADWAMNASIIEACSCPMFCQCYFNDKPAAHGEHAGHSHGDSGEHFCKFNNAFKVNHGHYGSTKLDGAKFWVAGKRFEFKGTNGFMVTIDINSKDAAKQKVGT
jgi:hypothetical protein